MSCDELMSHLAAFDKKIKEAMAEVANHARNTQRQHAVRRRLRETSKDLVREINRRCPAIVTPTSIP